MPLAVLKLVPEPIQPVSAFDWPFWQSSVRLWCHLIRIGNVLAHWNQSEMISTQIARRLLLRTLGCWVQIAIPWGQWAVSEVHSIAITTSQPPIDSICTIEFNLLMQSPIAGKTYL